MTHYQFNAALTESGWLTPGYISVDDDGMITHVGSDKPDSVSEIVNGIALPGFQNAHSHSFQYAMAGAD